MINIPFVNQDPRLQASLRELARRSVDGSIDGYRVLKHSMGNTADSSAIASTASETNFSLNKTLSTSQFFPGRIFKLSASGVYSTTGTPTLVFKVKFGTTALITFTAKTGINNASNQSWRVDAVIIVRTTGATGTVLPYGTLFINTASGVDTVETVVNSAVTVDTTANQTLQVSLTWGASSSSNTATMKAFLSEVSDY